METGGNLRVYRASAGSGKTFTLVAEYIAFAIAGGSGMPAFASILAITFTNKATAEMKMRILSTLWAIGHGQRKADACAGKIAELLNGSLSEDEIRQRCHETLHCILAGYDFFDVMTIDSFFQRILGDIAAMIGFNSSLQVFLDDSETVEAAVDSLIAKAAEGSDRRATLLLQSYIERNLDDNPSWDFRRPLKRFAQNVCSEIYMRNAEEINRVFGNPGKCAEIRSAVEQELERAKSLLPHLADSLTIDFSQWRYGPNIGKYIAGVASGDITQPTTAAESFLSGKYGKAKVSPEQMEEWRQQFENYEHDRQSIMRRINSAQLTLANWGEMQTLEAVDNELKRMLREENRMLLSKTQELVARQLGDGDSISFVFERAGRKYRHIMLDEAQDTSQMQFDNLGKLITNVTASQGNRCVVVGDVKQSIYRWRGGNWNILHDLASRYDPDGKFCLKENHRSQANVVRFNNSAFAAAASAQGEDIAGIYSDVEQIACKPEGEGYVKVYETDSDNALPRLFENIEEVHRAGVPYCDMAILARNNKEILKIAEYADRHCSGLRINTREAYCIANSTAVKTVVAALRFAWGEATGAVDNVSGYFAAREYQRLQRGEGFAEPIFPGGANPTVREYTEAMLPPGFMAAAPELMQLGIAEAAMHTARIFNVQLRPDESQYMFTFFDWVNDYSQRNAFDFKKFFSDWQTESEKCFIASGEESGIKAMTIHKSKGLEFHTVFVPFCDWKFIIVNDIQMWCRPKGKIYDEIPLLPITFKKDTQNSIYEDNYNREVFDITVDNINEVYVAFTRAIANLIVGYTPPSGKEPTINSIRASHLVAAALDKASATVGKISVPQTEDSDATDGNPFSPQSSAVELRLKMEN